jgi:hypothetical protein
MCRSQSLWLSQIFCCPSVPCCACVEVLGAVDDRLGGFVEEDETHPANWQRSMVSGSRRPRALYLLTLVPLSPSCCLYLVLSSSRVPPCRAMSLAIVRSPSRCAAAVSCCLVCAVSVSRLLSPSRAISLVQCCLSRLRAVSTSCGASGSSPTCVAARQAACRPSALGPATLR